MVLYTFVVIKGPNNKETPSKLPGLVGAEWSGCKHEMISICVVKTIDGVAVEASPASCLHERLKRSASVLLKDL